MTEPAATPATGTETSTNAEPSVRIGTRRRGDRARRRPTAVTVAVDALQGFCLGPDGRAAAASELRKLGLPSDEHHVDDVCQAVLSRVWARLEAGDPAADAELHAGIVPYARRAVTNAAVDLLRSARRERLDAVLVPRRAGGSDDEARRDEAADPATDLDGRQALPWSDDEADRAFAPAVRWAVQCLHLARPRLDTWVTSAALTTSHLADYPGLDLLPGTPVPDPQSPAATAGPRWAGLAYAGRRDCWASPETGAVRERRSRALKRVDALLGEAIDLARDGAPPEPTTGEEAP